MGFGSKNKQDKTDTSVYEWTVEDVAHYLNCKGLDDFSPLFLREKICGKVLFLLNDEYLAQIGISALGERLRILELINKLKQHDDQNMDKIIHDPIHGSIRIHPLCVKIIDTPEFQRLRYLKQLGCSYFVFPSATHSRFEHCIGVYYLAEKLMRELKRKFEYEQKNCISEKDILCVSIAGLCHDLGDDNLNTVFVIPKIHKRFSQLFSTFAIFVTYDIGHGPFSHTWERFLEEIRPDSAWKHEEMSVKIFKRIWDKLNPEDKRKYHLEDVDKNFIGELITGQQNSHSNRPQFLYEIVANKITGIDVDKWDYMIRDSYYLGLKESFDYQRLIQFIRVLTVNGKETICYKISEEIPLFNMFYSRWILHHRAYKHRVSRIIERMLLDALKEADKYLLTTGINNTKFTLSDAVDDIDAFLKLNDSVYHRIRTELDKTHRSFELVEQIECRNLYISVDEILISDQFTYDALDIEEMMSKEDDLENIPFYIDVLKFDYGMKQENPLKYVEFYEKTLHNEIIRTEKKLFSEMLPQKFEEVKLYCVLRETSLSEKTSKLRSAFRNWISKKNIACLNE